MRLILVRHGESKKNLVDIIGGQGDSLTCQGRFSAKRAAVLIRKLNPTPAYLVFAPTVQTRQTARIFSQYLPKAILQESNLLEPINLGCISGLTVCEAKLRFPLVMDALGRWNRREIDISELKIPGMQDVYSFYRQGLVLLNDARKRRLRCICVIATRSSLVLFRNIKERTNPEVAGGYFNYEFAYARPISIQLTAKDFHWIRQQVK